MWPKVDLSPSENNDEDVTDDALRETLELNAKLRDLDIVMGFVGFGLSGIWIISSKLQLLVALYIISDAC